MDTSALKVNLNKALDLLPQGMVNEQTVAEWINRWRKPLEKIVPDIIELLKQDVMTAMFEAGMYGDAVKDEIEAACVEVLMSRGLGKIAQAGSTR